MSGTGGSEYQVWPPPQCGGPIPCAIWPHDAVTFTHLTVSGNSGLVQDCHQTRCFGLPTYCVMALQRHAAVMGTTWSILIPATVLMARLRNKKGWWFTLHQSLAVLSLVLVLVGAILGRRLQETHPPVTVAGKCHKFMGYTATSFITAQVRKDLPA